MSLSLDQLKAAFNKKDTDNAGRPNNYYPFWNLAEGQQAVVRFLPDKATNPLGFLVEKLMHSLEVNGEKKSIACLKMYGEECPICKVSSAYYKAEDKANGKKFWRKKQHIAQALVIEDPMPADEQSGETHQGKVRFLALGYQLFNVIKEAFEGGELDDVPYSMDGGYDFVIKKTKQGDYSTYAVGSRFRAKARSLNETERQTAEDQMIELATLLPQNPGEEKVSGLLNASLNGTEYQESQSSDSKPAGLTFNKKGAAPKAPSKPAASEEDDNIPLEETAAPSKPAAKAADNAGVDAEAADILANIRSRMKKKVE